jgi:hypothetical protein
MPQWERGCDWKHPWNTTQHLEDIWKHPKNGCVIIESAPHENKMRERGR